MTVCIQAEGEYCPWTPELSPWRQVAQYIDGEWVIVVSEPDWWVVGFWVIMTSLFALAVIYRKRQEKKGETILGKK